jgi:aspartyl/asparaginyl beta-hydroxylase (cupin superfamily)/Tfp pilus assembly protein PilF
MELAATPAEDAAKEQRLVALMSAAERLSAERREDEALRAFRQAEALDPEHPLVLHERARRCLAAGELLQAHALFEQAVARAPDRLPFWLSYAAVLRKLARPEEELQALERALAIDPTHLVVLLQKGAVLELLSRPRAAANTYLHALQTLAPGTRLPPAVEAHVNYARQRAQENARVLGAQLESRLNATHLAERPGAERQRFDRCMDRMLGRRRIYTPEPTSMLFPFLRNFEFFERNRFPWLPTLEAATDAIREELLGVLQTDQPGIRPYIDYRDGLPLNQWRELNGSRRWGAYFLLNQGRREEAHLARCPHTAAALARVPQVDIPGQAPNGFFSMLDAHTRIPPHTGVTNTRVTVHLPLVVPPGCSFRVGGEVREWRVGSAWVFDDTIEHEAWNETDEARAILIFDVWNPELTALECDLVREAETVIYEYSREENAR